MTALQNIEVFGEIFRELRKKEKFFVILYSKNYICLFIEIRGLPSTNNLAERDLRPFVIHRKASFGSKSFDGAQAKVIFKTIFENNKRKGYLFSDALNFLFENYKEDLLLSKT